MTLVIAVKRYKKIAICADSASVSGQFCTVGRMDKKIHQFDNGVVIGFTTSYRMGQLLHYKIEPPDLNRQNSFGTMLDYAEECRKKFKEYGFGKHGEAQNADGGSFIIVGNGHIFEINVDFQVVEYKRVAVIGGGEEPAAGAADALLKKTDLSAHEIALTASKIAAARITTVYGPFTIYDLE